MNKTSDWIDGIIQDLVDSDKNISDTLLKVQVLAHKLKNQRLQEWTESELNGFQGKEIPKYRIIPSVVQGNLIQDRGFGSYATRNNATLPIEYLDKELFEELSKVKINSQVSELERMVREKGQYRINIPYGISSLVENFLANDWRVDSAWRMISLNSIEGILSSIKSTLLKFLLELNDELGENYNFSIMDKKKEIDKVFDKTIGSISGETVNVTIGNSSIQSVNSGDNAQMNIAKGNNINQQIDLDLKEEIKGFIDLLQQNLEKLNLSKEDKEDITIEVQRINNQIQRDSPKNGILNTALSTIQGILTGIAANAYTPIVLDKIGELLGRL